MKAVVIDRYGPPDVLHLEDIAEPVVGANDVLVKLVAASVNAGDWHVMRADPWIVRVAVGGLFKPRHRVLGSDFAGRVEAVGSAVTLVKVGDEVFGESSGSGFGTFAEYVRVTEQECVPKPASVTFQQAAAVPQAGLVALQATRDWGGLTRGQTVLVNGASGGVGLFLVQIANALGGHVTGVCSTRNVEMVRAAGADRVIDYTAQDFTKTGPYDLVIDAAAHRALDECLSALGPQGTYVFVGGTNKRTFQVMLFGPLRSRKSGRRVVFRVSQPKRDDLIELSRMLERGTLKPAIDRTYPLAQVPDAVRYVEQGHARGKVVITM